MNIIEESNLNPELYQIKEYKKGDIIFNENDECTKIGYIMEGSITIKTITYFNNEFEINNINEGDFYGSYLLFSDSNKYLGTAVAMKKTIVLEFTKNKLLKAFENKIFLEKYLSILSSTSLRIQEKVKILSQGSIRDKIFFLLNNNYKKTKNLTLYFKTKEKLALYLCIPRPSLSRELINLQREGLIRFDNKSITLIKKS